MAGRGGGGVTTMGKGLGKSLFMAGWPRREKGWVNKIWSE
jgi:hypothetical protein